MRTDSLSMKYSLIITWTYCIITLAVKGSVSKWPYVYESLKFHSTSLETALLNIRCSSQCSVCMFMCVYIWMVVLGCVLYLARTNNWNNLPKKKKITSDNFFFSPLVIRLQRYLVCEWHWWYSGSLWTIQCCADVHTRSFSAVFK